MSKSRPFVRDMDMHLDDDVIAAIADGAEAGTHDHAIAHLGVCADCRDRVVQVATLLEDPAIRSEIDVLEPPLQLPVRRRWSPATWAAVTTLVAAAAGVAIVIYAPISFDGRLSSVPSETRREGTLTTTAPPRIVSPRYFAAATDSLRWTKVSAADLYRVQIWNQEGTVVWSGETQDTVIALPKELRANTGYLWEVKARTGWDRWVASDFLDFIIRPAGRR